MFPEEFAYFILKQSMRAEPKHAQEIVIVDNEFCIVANDFIFVFHSVSFVDNIISGWSIRGSKCKEACGMRVIGD